MGKTVTCDPQKALEFWPKRVDSVIIKIVEYNNIIERLRSLTDYNSLGSVKDRGSEDSVSSGAGSILARR